MIAQLPDEIKERTVELIRAGDFVGAKDLHDQWLVEHGQCIEYSA